MEVIAVFVVLLSVLFKTAAPQDDCILGNWQDIGSVPNSQLMFRIQQPKDDDSLPLALALTPNPQWATGAVSYDEGTRAIVIQLDSLDTIKGTVSNDCSNITWTVPQGAAWIKVPRVEKVHVIFMNHLDVGYAKFIGDIINEYFDTYFPRAIELGIAAESWRNGRFGFVYTTHPWLVSMYLDCPPSLEFNGIPIHCPTADAISAFEKAVIKGHITWHAGPMNMQVEFLDSVLLSAGLKIAENLNTRFNKSDSIVLSQRDVPGLTVAAIPVLAKHGVKGVSVGVNPGSAPPAVPKIFSWQYRGESVVGLWHAGGYPLNPGSSLQHAGGISVRDCTVAPGTAHALCLAFRTDNTGPPTSLQELDTYYDILSEEFPEANVVASTFDDFVKNVNTSSLPVVSDKEIGDNWIQGIASDPLKCSMYRAAALGLSECMQNGDCDINDQRVFNATRFLIKLPEHTWGLPGIHDTGAWSNVDFQTVRKSEGTFKDNENSWKEQRTFLNLTLAACEGHKLHEYMLRNLEDVVPVMPNITNYKEIDPLVPVKLLDGKLILSFNSSIGSINQLTYQVSTEEVYKFATAQNQLGVLTYHSYDEADFQFMNSHYDYYGNAGYAKPGSSIARPESRIWPVKLVKVYQSTVDPALFTVQLTMADNTTHIKYGAPAEVWTTIQLTTAPGQRVRGQGGTPPTVRVDYDVMFVNKTTTRLPEATMFSFYPNPPVSSSGWTGYLGKVDSEEISVGSVVKNGSQYQHAVQYVKLSATDGSGLAVGENTVKMNSTHVPLVCPITGDGRSPTPFPAPLDPIPDKVIGMAFNVHNNIWNTNYPLYYPFVDDDANIRSKFTIVFT